MKTIICSDMSTPLIISNNKNFSHVQKSHIHNTEVASPQNMAQLIMTHSIKSSIHKYL